MTFDDLQLQFKNYALFEKGMTASSYKSIVRTLNWFQEYSNIQNVKLVKENNIREFMVEMKNDRQWSSKTYKTYLQNIRSYFNWCQKRGFVKKNPTTKIDSPKLPKSLPRCLTKEDFLKIMAQFESMECRYPFLKIRNRTILYLFTYCGLRLQELLNLRIEDVDLDAQEIFIRQGKGKKDRIVPIHTRLHAILKTYLTEKHRKNTKASIWLFSGRNSGKKLQPRDIQVICRKISNESGIKFTPHMLRHTFARLSLDAGMDLFDVKEILGHTDISTTQVYLSVSKEKLKSRLRNVELV